MIRWAYLFEAKGIQRYLFHSGKLRDVIGGSDLIANLARGDGDDIGDVCEQVGIAASLFSRRAGGAFCLHAADKDELVQLRAAWRGWVMARLPGLEFSDALCAGESDYAAMTACFIAAGGMRCNYAAQALPLGRPGLLYAPRTGMPAIQETKYGDRVDLIDMAARGRGDALISKHQAHPDRFTEEQVLRRFVPQDRQAGTIRFPVHFDPNDQRKNANDPVFPARETGHGDDRRFAIVHADLSGLGELFRTMGDKFAGFEDFAGQNRNLAASIETAIIAAAQAATGAVLLPHCVNGVVPARPILLGGDDITVLVRADLAVAYAAALLEAIEEKCKGIGTDAGLALSACAGVAIVGPKTPFVSANALADALCGHAKKAVKALASPTLHGRKGYASALSFYVQQQNAQEDLADITASYRDADCKPLWHNPWIVGSGAVPGCGRAEELFALAAALDQIEGGRSTVRELRQLMTQSTAHARARLKRWQQILMRRQGGRLKALEALVGQIDDADFAPAASGLFDAEVLIDLGHAHGVAA